MVARAGAAGVATLLTPSPPARSHRPCSKLARRFPNVWVASGVHPHQAAEEAGSCDPAPFIANAADPKVVAIGRMRPRLISTTRARVPCSGRAEAQLEAARATGLPFIVHTRDADADTLAVLEAAAAKAPLRGVIHCYSTSPEMGRGAVAMGLHLGLGGILTFRRSDELRATVRDLPRDRILLETDSPFLAPLPYRGKRNEPAYIPHVAAVLAELWGTGTDEVARVTTDNFFRLFAKAARP
ncbi:MAG: TatD family hydrolase [Geminicoccaceae bacterium]